MGGVDGGCIKYRHSQLGNRRFEYWLNVSA